MIYSFLKSIFRSLINVRQDENILSAIDRHLVKIKKIVGTNKEIYSSDFRNSLIQMGLKNGDNLMVHASWRQFYNYRGSPSDIISILKDVIGEEGSLFMPSYGKSKFFFDVANTPTSAGVLAEVFRQEPETERSISTHFSISGQGPSVNFVFKDHKESSYGFDDKSAYYKFSQLPNSKILMLGLGRKPTKISLFHCAAFTLIETDEYIRNIINHHYESVLIYNGKKVKKSMITRRPNVRNNNRVFKKIFDNISKKDVDKISNLNLVVIDAQEGLEKTKYYASKGKYCYK